MVSINGSTFNSWMVKISWKIPTKIRMEPCRWMIPSYARADPAGTPPAVLPDGEAIFSKDKIIEQDR